LGWAPWFLCPGEDGDRLNEAEIQEALKLTDQDRLQIKARVDFSFKGIDQAIEHAMATRVASIIIKLADELKECRKRISELEEQNVKTKKRNADAQSKKA